MHSWKPNNYGLSHTSYEFFSIYTQNICYIVFSSQRIVELNVIYTLEVESKIKHRELYKNNKMTYKTLGYMAWMIEDPQGFREIIQLFISIEPLPWGHWLHGIEKINLPFCTHSHWKPFTALPSQRIWERYNYCLHYCLIIFSFIAHTRLAFHR